ncbi:MAG: sugar phosphate isomerase/epimerase family protein [Granulosicoccaceae bacterium]
MKLGVITDGINRDLKHALAVMDEYQLQYAELQYVWDKEVGDLNAEEIAKVKQLITRHDKRVSCISRHIFAGIHATQNSPGDRLHTQHLDALKRCIELAHTLDCKVVRIMSPLKGMILWGKNGAEKWNVAHGSWDSTLPFIAPAVELAKSEGIKLACETGNGTQINSCYTARKLIDDLDAKGSLFTLWDPANNCWAHEVAYPDGYEEIRDGYLGHIHIKDVLVDTPRATLEVRRMGEGQLANQFEPMARALHADAYDGVISFESVYHPGNGDFEAGFRQCIEYFKQTFSA